MFVLALAVAGAVSVVVVAGRSAAGAREKLLAGELARTALADAAYAADVYRSGHAGALDFGAAPFNALPYAQKPADALGPAGCQKGAPGNPEVGWLWRAHYDAVNSLYSLDVWVFRKPTGTVCWDWCKDWQPDTSPKREQTLLYLRSRLETRKP